MSAAMLITYLWHYLAARAIYDELVRPVTGHPAVLPLMVLIAALAFLIGRRSVRR